MNPDKKVGRPTIYTPELADEICDKISSCSYGLRHLCTQNSHWPNRDTIYVWLKKHKYFADQYILSKKQQIEPLVDDLLEIADDSSQDKYINSEGNEVVDQDHIARARLRIDTRKWLASKLVPKLYGDLGMLRQLAEDMEEFKKMVLTKGASSDVSLENNNTEQAIEV